jgi:hypothetical protein
MVTVAQYWIAASYVISIGFAIDQMRRPLQEWEAAGRHRRFWVSVTLVTGFHGLGQYAALAYLILVVPRFHGSRLGESRRALRRATKLSRPERSITAVEELALVAALLVFASSFIHSALIGDHFEEHWLMGVFFAVVTLGQAVWAVLIYGNPLNRRLLVAGVVGNLAVAVVWAISRTSGVPLGSHPWEPEPVGEVDLFATLDELGAAVLALIVLAGLRGARLSVSNVHLRIAAMLAGPLFIWSVLAAFGAEHTHPA